MKTLEKIESILKNQLDINHIKIEDESHLHSGHKQNQNAGSGGHYKAVIISKSFDNLSLIERHRLVYKALGDLIGKEIHAFSMKTISNKEKNSD